MRRRWLIGLLLCGGCLLNVGPRPEAFEPAQTASGIRAAIAVSSSSVQGELLEVREDGVVVLTSDRVVMVPYDAITSSAFANAKVTVGGRQPPLFEDRRKLQLLSRFPQGIPQVALDRLLASKSQTAVAVVR